jgi:hypothetical protein
MSSSVVVCSILFHNLDVDNHNRLRTWPAGSTRARSFRVRFIVSRTARKFFSFCDNLCHRQCSLKTRRNTLRPRVFSLMSARRLNVPTLLSLAGAFLLAYISINFACPCTKIKTLAISRTLLRRRAEGLMTQSALAPLGVALLEQLLLVRIRLRLRFCLFVCLFFLTRSIFVLFRRSSRSISMRSAFPNNTQQRHRFVSPPSYSIRHTNPRNRSACWR